jgi:hypothetical protein
VSGEGRGRESTYEDDVDVVLLAEFPGLVGTLLLFPSLYSSPSSHCSSPACTSSPSLQLLELSLFLPLGTSFSDAREEELKPCGEKGREEGFFF